MSRQEWEDPDYSGNDQGPAPFVDPAEGGAPADTGRDEDVRRDPPPYYVGGEVDVETEEE